MTKLRQKMQDRMALRGFASTTQEIYLRWITLLAKYFRQSPDQLDDDQIQQYMLYLINTKKLSAATCRQAIHVFRFFYADVVGRELSKFSLPNLRQPSKIPELLSRNEVFAIFKACDNHKYRTMMMVCYGTGIRLSEVIHLKLSDIHGDRKVMRIEQGKGRKDRYVLLNDSLLTALREYWQKYRPYQYLFYGRDFDQSIGTRSFQKMFGKARDFAGIQKKVSVHSMRHAFATHSLEAGMPLPKLQQLLGHKQISTTLRYVHWLPRYQEHPEDQTDLLTGWEASS